MAKFKAIISDPKDGTSKTVELEDTRAASLIGRRIGEVIDGSVVDLPSYRIRISGGSDKDGFPMRPSVHGGVRRRIVLSQGVGFNPAIEGLRRRKTIRGNVITDEIVQVNLEIIEKAKKQQKESKKTKGKTEETPTKETEKEDIPAQKSAAKKAENL